MLPNGKLTKIIDRLLEQIARKDFSAAFNSLKRTNFRPVKAMQKFVKHAQPTLATKLVHAFKEYCMTGLTKENVFNRAGNLCLLLSLYEHTSVVGYLKEKQRLLDIIEGFGVPVPLLLLQKMREIDYALKCTFSPEKLIALGFEQVGSDDEYLKYTHPELSIVIAVQIPKAKEGQFEEKMRLSALAKAAFVKPKTHEGWLALGFTVKHQTFRAIYYSRHNERGKEECYTVWYTDTQIAEIYHREMLARSAADEGEK